MHENQQNKQCRRVVTFFGVINAVCSCAQCERFPLAGEIVYLKYHLDLELIRQFWGII